MTDNQLPAIDVNIQAVQLTEAEWEAHLKAYKKQNPEKYIAKERIGDFERQKELIFGQADENAKRTAEKIALQAEKAKLAKIAEAKKILAELEVQPEVSEEPKKGKPAKSK